MMNKPIQMKQKIRTDYEQFVEILKKNPQRYASCLKQLKKAFKCGQCLVFVRERSEQEKVDIMRRKAIFDEFIEHVTSTFLDILMTMNEQKLGSDKEKGRLQYIQTQKEVCDPYVVLELVRCDSFLYRANLFDLKDDEVREMAEYMKGHFSELELIFKRLSPLILTEKRDYAHYVNLMYKDTALRFLHLVARTLKQM